MVNIVGNHDGSSAVDYTVNPATGFAWATGPRNLAVPFNHLLPAWDAITGALATTSLLAAERARARTGAGQYVRIALSDVAFWMVGNLGKIAEVQINRHERAKDGNYLYGAFGRDFLTKDGHRVMIVALTLRQWRNLVEATGLGDAFDAIARLMDVDLDDEGGRFVAREVLGATLKPWVLARTLAGAARDVRPTTACRGAPTRHSPSWSSAIRAARREPDVRRSRPAQASGRYLMPGSPLAFSERRAPARRPPRRCSASTPTRCWPACWA